MTAKTLKPSSKDRRRSERKEHLVQAWISSPTATDPSEKVEVKSVNISRHGVCFSVSNAIPLGAFYVIEVMMDQQKIVSEVQIVDCRKAPTGQFDVGAEFC
jgi:hypothetical protein